MIIREIDEAAEELLLERLAEQETQNLLKLAQMLDEARG